MTDPDSSVPAHLVVVGTERHGVTVLARQLAAEVGADVVTDLDEAAVLPRVHVHVTDRLFGDDPAAAADRLRTLATATRTTVTLHDVPQPSDGDGFEPRRACYAAVVAAAAGWVVSSEAERRTVERHCTPRDPGAVVHLPVWPPDAVPVAPRGPVAAGAATVGLFGWVYPGKGHADAIAACAELGSSAATRPTVVAVGEVAAGHADLLTDLQREADERGVRFRCTGWLADDEVRETLAAITVGFAGHGNVSASGSVNQWLAAGRRPLVRSSPYMREIADLRPGTIELYPDGAGPAEVAALIGRRLADPGLGVVAPGTVVRPDLAEVGRAYRRWWRS